jgi:hypothetical protein
MPPCPWLAGDVIPVFAGPEDEELGAATVVACPEPPWAACPEAEEPGITTFVGFPGIGVVATRAGLAGITTAFFAGPKDEGPGVVACVADPGTKLSCAAFAEAAEPGLAATSLAGIGAG